MAREAPPSSYDTAVQYGLRGLAIAAMVLAVVYGYNGGDPEASDHPPVIFGLQLPSVFGEPIKTEPPSARAPVPSSAITIPDRLPTGSISPPIP